MRTPDLTGLLLWALYHHQGGSSPVGQPIRQALGIERHAHLTKRQIAWAKRAAGCTPVTPAVPPCN